MKLKIDQVMKSIAVSLSCMTMVFSPVAMGKEAEGLTKASVTAAIKDSGLGPKQTVGQFWDKVKYDLPGTMYQDLEGFVKENRNMAMPEVSVDSVKSTSGEDVPVVRLTQNGKTDTIQFFGEQNKYVKYNGVVLTAADVQQLRKASEKIIATDVKLKQGAVAYEKQQQAKKDQADMKRDFARFTAFPRITPVMWKSMKLEQKVSYIVSMRRLWQSAKTVNALSSKSQVRKSKKSAAIDNFLKVILGEDAQAKTPTPGQLHIEVVDPDPNYSTEGLIDATERRVPAALRQAAAPPKPAKVAAAAPLAAGVPAKPAKPAAADVVPDQGALVSEVVVNGRRRPAAAGKECVVAGYIGVEDIGTNDRHTNVKVCSVDRALENPDYKDPAKLGFVDEANKACRDANGPDFVACNPVIYGYQRKEGKTLCISKTSPQFQLATTNPGDCDTNSRLSDGSKFETHLVTDSAGRSQDVSLMESQQAAADEKGVTYKLTREYLDSILAKPNTASGRTEATTLDDVLKGPWTKQLDSELVQIQQNFEKEITTAMATCEKEHLPEMVDPHQGEACQQLHRRWLFTEKFVSEFRSKGCLDGSTYIGAITGKVSEATGRAATLNKTQLADGEAVCQCSPGSQPAPPPPPPPPSSAAPSQSLPPSPPASAPAAASGSLVAIGVKCPGSPAAPPVLTPPEPPPPPSTVTPPVTCAKGKPGKDGKCDDDGGGFPLWAKIALGLTVVGGILCLTHTLICKKKKDAPTCSPALQADCANRQGALDPNTCICTAACSQALVSDCSTRGGSLNAASCLCTVAPPPSCTGYTSGNPCMCNHDLLAAACTSGQRPSMTSCSCVPKTVQYCPDGITPVSSGCPVIVVKCPDGVTPLVGSVNSCPKCSDGSLVIQGQSCPQPPQPPPSEGGNGSNNGGYGGVH